ncbi:MAG: DNA polymerase III subunit beta [Rhodospirillaceae bacterium]|nr:DNA polymerase III subunit beta [Rhodospirillaceae bacterium]
MKLTIERAALLTALTHTQSVVEKRNTIPILSNVLVDADGGQLRLTATDLDLAIVDQAEADIATPGSTTTPAHTLYDIVRKLPEGAQIELVFGEEAGESRVSLVAGRSSFMLPCLPKEDFPVIAEGELPHSFSLPADLLIDVIDKTRFAVSTEETRYYLNGIYLHKAEVDGRLVLRAVATDGHRLAQVNAQLPEGASDIPGVIVPRKAVAEVRKLIDEGGLDIGISLSDSKIRFQVGESILTSKLIDGTFPDYQRVIPDGNDKVMEVDAKVFAEAIDRVSTVSTEKSRAVKMSLEGGKATIAASSPDNASASEEIAVEYNSDNMEIGFNSRYLLDIASQIDGETAQFVLADAVSPTLIRDGGNADALYVLMPMRV